MHLGDFTNEIYDQGTAAFKEADTMTVFLGVLVTLLPKIIPRVMPAFLGDAKLREKFQDEAYVEQVEEMFREKFTENLSVFENLIKSWQDETLEPEHFGLDANHILAREDLIAGEPESFQSELLLGINFLKERMARSERSGTPDAITNMADTIWGAATAVYHVVAVYLNF